MAIFAIDAGGTRIKLAAVAGGRVVDRATLEAQSAEGLESSLPRIAEAFRRFDATPTGISMAFPSLTEGNRVIGNVGKYLDAENLDLVDWARSEFNVPLALENDARMAAIGEWRYGAGRGTTDMVMVTLGTGIGTGVVSEGRVLRGRHGAAGVLGGHMTACIGGLPCACGNVGCWETEASTVALPSMGEYLDYETVFTTPDAVEVKNQSLEVWSALAVSLVHAYDPEILVFGGGVMRSGEAVLGPIRQYVEHYAWTPWGKPKVVASQLEDDAALLAGEWLFEEKR